MKGKKKKMESRISKIISSKIGMNIGEEHIHNDKKGWYHYIPNNSLKSKHPLIMSHYRGPLFVVIPSKDWDALEANEIDVETYVDTSYWSYGYFWAQNPGAYWQQLEETPGIQDKERIRRYLRILSCRTFEHSGGCRHSENACRNCFVEHCPMSTHAFKSEGASWENEVIEVDKRKTLCEAVKSRIKEQLGFEAVSFIQENIDESTIHIYTSYKEGAVSVYLPQSILIDMLYNPKKYTEERIAEIAKTLDLVACIRWKINKNFPDGIEDGRDYKMPKNATAEDFYQFWKTDKSCSWFRNEEYKVQEEPEIVELFENDPKGDFFKRVAKFFKKF